MTVSSDLRHPRLFCVRDPFGVWLFTGCGNILEIGLNEQKFTYFYRVSYETLEGISVVT